MKIFQLLKEDKNQLILYVKKMFLYSMFGIIVTYLLSIMVIKGFNLDVEEVVNRIDNSLNYSINEPTVWEFFKNNGIAVPFQMLLIAFLPIPFLYFINYILTIIVPGFLLAIVQVLNLNVLKMVILGFLPHALVEILGFIIVLYYTTKVNKSILQAVYRRKNHRNNDLLIDSLKKWMIAYICLVVPIIFLAAVIEGVVTKVIINI